MTTENFDDQLSGNNRKDDYKGQAAALEFRYISHVEDDPCVWQRYFETLDEALAATSSLVVERMKRNGAGDGMVFDRIERRIVAACDGETQDGRFTGAVAIRRFPEPKFLEQCAKLVEGWASELCGSAADVR